MPNLGFDVRDYSTRARVGTPPADDLLVLVARRDSGLPPLVERPLSSVKLTEKRLFFPTRRSASGLVVLPGVPPGTYRARVRARHYVQFEASVVAPHLAPVAVLLHRDAAFPFGAEDTLLRGRVVTAAGKAHTGFDVQMNDTSGPSPVTHRVPLNADGEFVIFAREKTTPAGVQLRAFHQGGSVVMNVANVTLHRSNEAPLITVP